MSRESLLDVTDFPSLVSYLADELDWPLDDDAFEDYDALAFDYSPTNWTFRPTSAPRSTK